VKDTLTEVSVTNFRGVYMILSTKLHMMEVTLSSMILKALNLVQLKSWRMFGNSLRSGSGTTEVKRSVTCNFLGFSHIWVTMILSGIVYQWTALVLSCLQNLISSIKGLGEGKWRSPSCT
jgi:hypothetical protein